ncbi:MAG: RNA-binding protein [Bacteroidetes bacterium GWF2_41_9]|nr:MAG: RNA-binding protein [Bacteroidetes bacterium GWF2_41_9]
MNRIFKGIFFNRYILISCMILFQISVSELHSQETKLFQPVPPQKSGITFKNTITENEEANALTHENLYNGGGVATGDINNDGLEDIFFISNMGFNKLYLNLGDLKFKDITKSSGVEGRAGWKTGVTMADVNGDGLTDIYVCFSGKGSPELRRNELYINKGNLRFEEKAKEFGIDDNTYSTIGAFLDYDLDGDIDLFLVATNVIVIRGMDFEDARKVNDPYAGDKLYRNDGNHFTDVTLTSGIISNAMGYGLGVNVSDINKDGLPDIYVTNDYIEPDYLYINNGDGTFTNRLTDYIQHISQSAMGCEIADFNNDTWPDIFTADMLPADNRRIKLLYGPDNYMQYALAVMAGYYHSSMRNMLQMNNGNHTFSEIGQFSGISNTDWSWAPLFADFDNDGWKDFFISNGYFKDYTDRDFLKYKNDYFSQQARANTKPDTFMLTKSMKSTPVHNFIFKNNKDLTFSNKTIEWGLEKKGFSTGSVYSDLDNDGDLDLVMSNQNETTSLYRNMLRETNPKANYLNIRLKGSGKNTAGLGSKVYLYTGNEVQYLEQSPFHGYQSSVTTNLHFGLNNRDFADSVRVEWPGGRVSRLKKVKANQTIVIEESGEKQISIKPSATSAVFSSVGSLVPYEHVEYGSNDFKRQPLLHYMPSPVGPVIAIGDVNGDKLPDIFAGGAKESPGKLFVQSADGKFRASPFFNYKEDFNCTDADALFFDADNDGDQDLYVVSGGYNDYARSDNALQDRLYINSGSGRFARRVDALPPMPASGSCVKSADFDKDGDNDLFVGGRLIPGEYPRPQKSYLLVNDGKGKFTNNLETLIPELKSGGMITDAAWVDLNKDTWPDLVVCGEFMPIRIFINEKGKKFTEATKSYFPQSDGGLWNRIAFADFDKDGDLDLVAGNWGTNSQFKCSPEKPMQMTFKDFDNNGSVDPVLTYYIDGKSYPWPSRDEIIAQIPVLRRKFPDYKSYADAQLKDIFQEGDLINADVLTATELRSVYYRNNNGKFEKQALPNEAQFAPVFAIEILDYDQDGNIDMILAGNQNAACVRLGVIDANYGQLFRGDGKGNFRYIPQSVSGLSLTGDVKSMKIITVRNISYLIAGINNLGIVTYKLNSK